jgi:serine phosphatase RsbU (regulator of sigma subunit)
MTQEEIQSVAFRQARLRSERHRILGVIVFVFVFAVLLSVRIYIFKSAVNPWAIWASLVLITYELVLLRAVVRAEKAGQDLPLSAWVASIMVETSFPAIGIAFLTSMRLPEVYRPLATPWVLAYFPFIVLSVLRLSPSVCYVSGCMATATYLASAYHHGWRFDLYHPAGQSLEEIAVRFDAALLLASGIIAGVVASEIRKYVQAALREAETERHLKQVQHDLEVARSIQQSLLPRVRPTLAGFEVAGWNRPADETGGDFFDWKKLPDGRLVVTMADVTGHGIGPALLASVCRAYSRASFDSRDDLATTIHRINESFGEDLTQGRFATYVAAVCKEGDDRLEFLSAGQAPLFVYFAATGELQKFQAQAMPLGIEKSLTSDAPVALNLEPGDILLFITDGFFEWENAAGEQFGFDRLADAVRKSSHLPPEEIIAELYNAVLAFAGGTPQKDDLTAVLIKRTGQPAGQLQA